MAEVMEVSHKGQSAGVGYGEFQLATTIGQVLDFVQLTAMHLPVGHMRSSRWWAGICLFEQLDLRAKDRVCELCIPAEHVGAVDGSGGLG